MTIIGQTDDLIDMLDVVLLYSNNDMIFLIIPSLIKLDGMNPVIVEWLMGHDIGIAKHYLADNIKREYPKFEQKASLSKWKVLLLSVPYIHHGL